MDASIEVTLTGAAPAYTCQVVATDPVGEMGVKRLTAAGQGETPGQAVWRGLCKLCAKVPAQAATEIGGACMVGFGLLAFVPGAPKVRLIDKREG